MSESKIKKSALSFPVIFEKIDDIESADDRFTKVRIWLMHLGENFNGSVFEKDVVDKAISTLEYIPIVAFIEDNKLGEKDYSNHRYIITKDEKGVCRKYMGNAYGVVTSSDNNNAHYEDRLCDDGETRTFLVVDGLIWNMFDDSSEIMNRDLIKGQSMELWDDGHSIEGFEDEETGLFHFTKFSFRAACILGSDYEPAMINSTIEVQFTMSDFVKSIQDELNNKYITFEKIINNKNNQGGKITMPKTDFTQTALEQFADISNIVRQYEVVEDRWGDTVPRYYLHDIQDDEVIVVDRNNNYQYYGYPLSFEGDKPVIDFACGGKRKKTRYENYEEGTAVPDGGFNFGKYISEIEEKAFNKVEESNTKASKFELEKNKIEQDYTQIKAKFEEIEPKYNDYVQLEQSRLAAELDAKKDAEFAKYESVLADNADFISLKENKSNMSVKEIESECAILYARKNLSQSNFSKSNNVMTAGLIDNTEKEGFVETKYGYIPIKR